MFARHTLQWTRCDCGAIMPELHRTYSQERTDFRASSEDSEEDAGVSQIEAKNYLEAIQVINNNKRYMMMLFSFNYQKNTSRKTQINLSTSSWPWIKSQYVQTLNILILRQSDCIRRSLIFQRNFEISSSITVYWKISLGRGPFMIFTWVPRNWYLSSLLATSH